MHYAKNSWAKSRCGGLSSDSEDELASEPEQRSKASWAARKTGPVAILPPRELHKEVPELLPLPSPVAPSSGEVRLALWQRSELDRSSSQVPDPDGDDGDDGVEVATAEVPEADEPVVSRAPTPGPEPPEEERESRLILPALESLISMRRDRLARNTSSRQLRPQDSGVSPEAAAAAASAVAATAAPSEAAAGGRATPRRTFSRAAPPASGQAAAASTSTSQLGDFSSSRPSTATHQPAAPAGPKPSLMKFPGLWRATRKWAGLGASAAAKAAAEGADPAADTSLPGSAGSGEDVAELFEPTRSCQSFTAGYTPRPVLPLPQPTPAGIDAGPVSGGQPRLLRFSPKPLRRGAPQTPPPPDAAILAEAARRSDRSGSLGGYMDSSSGVAGSATSPSLEERQHWQEWRRLAGPIPSFSTGQVDCVSADDIAGGADSGGSGGSTPGIGPQAPPLWMGSSASAAAAGPAVRAARGPPSRTPSFTVARNVASFSSRQAGPQSGPQMRMQVMSTGQLLMPTELQAGELPATAAAASAAAAAASATAALIAGGDGSEADGAVVRRAPRRTTSFSSAAWHPATGAAAAGPSRLGPQPPSGAPPGQVPAPPMLLRPGRSGPMRPTSRAALEAPPSNQPPPQRAGSAARFTFELRGGAVGGGQQQQPAYTGPPSPSALLPPPPELLSPTARQGSSAANPAQGQAPKQLMVTNSFRSRQPDPAVWKGMAEEVPQGLLAA